jgi:Na+-driven multidrug efflux pump
MSITSFIIISMSNYLPHFFSKNHEIIERTKGVMKLVALVHILDVLQVNYKNINNR